MSDTHPLLYTFSRSENQANTSSIFNDAQESRTIVFVATTRDVELVVRELCTLGHAAVGYHAQMSSLSKVDNMRFFDMTPRCFMVATV